MLLPTGGEGEGWVEGKGGGVDGFAGGGEEGEGLGQEEGHPSLPGECKKEKNQSLFIHSFRRKLRGLWRSSGERFRSGRRGRECRGGGGSL